MRIVAAVPASGLLLGCALGVAWLELPRDALLTTLLIALGLLSVGIVRSHQRLVVTAVMIGAVSAGALLAEFAWQRVWRSPVRLVDESIAHDERAALVARGLSPPEEERASVVLVGRLREDAALRDGGSVSLRLATEWMGRPAPARYAAAANPVEGDLLLTVAGQLATARMHEWRRGRRLRLSAQLRRPTRYLDPGVPDQERSLARRGVTLVGSVKSGALVEVTARGGLIDETAAALRAFARRAVGVSVGRWSRRGAAIVIAIVMGDRSGLDAAVQQRLQEAGTYHVIAISGGNVAILAGLALTVFRLAGLLGRGAMIAAISGLLAYGAIVTGGASVDRATWMAVVYFAGRALDLRGPPLNTLAVVAGLLVAVDPLAIADAGFLLTFGASAGIMIASQVPLARSASPLARAALGLGVASLAAEAALFPVSAVFFSRVTAAGIALNFIAIPMMAMAQIAGMLVVPVFVVSPWLASGVGALAAFGAEALVRSADLVELVPRVAWRLAAPSAFAVLLYYGGLLPWWVLRRRRSVVTGSAETLAARRLRYASLAIALASGVWIAFEPWTWWVGKGDGRLHATFIDVGQGDAALIRFPRGQTMLIDAGGAPGGSAFDVGDRVVGRVLRTFGITRLDTLVVTHGDADHIGGARAIVKEFVPFDVWEGIPVPPSRPLQELRDEALRRRARWVRVQQNDEFFVDDVRVAVDHPGLADWERQDVRNDDSVVVELQWRDASIVFTGDIGAEAERSMEKRFAPSPLRVLKVPHHGSLTSSSESFLQALDPAVAVISVGRNNNFGHPALAVLKRLEALGTTIYRTDRDGAVSVSTDGRVLAVETFAAHGAGHEDTKLPKSQVLKLESHPQAQ